MEDLAKSKDYLSKMAKQPASLIPDEAIPLLQEHALFSGSFQQLTGLENPWEVNMKVFTKLHDKLLTVENQLRQNFPDQDITCMIAKDSIYWITYDLQQTIQEQINQSLSNMQNGGLLPVWQMTTSELLNNHIENMKKLILAVSHDVVLLQLLKDTFGENINFLNREFENCERVVKLLIDDLQDQGHFLSKAMSENLHFYERIRITYEMIERGEIDLDNLGYSVEALEQAELKLDERCKKELPSYKQRLTSIMSQMRESLRESENTQLSRSSRWVLAFSMVEEMPQGFKGQAEIANIETEGYSMMVSSREDELGPSESGQNALKSAEEAKAGTPPEPEPVPEAEPEPEPEPEPQEAGSQKKKRIRMAYTSRRR